MCANIQSPESGPLNIGIIGAGLIGGSLAAALKSVRGDRPYDLLPTITACDLNKDHLAYLKKEGLADHISTDNSLAARQCDIIFLAVPVRSMSGIIREIAPRLKQGCILSDTGSVKSCLVEEIEPLLPVHAQFVPGHPVAGKESSGPFDAHASLFRDKSYVLTPTSRTSSQALAVIKKLLSRTGARIFEMDARTHDRALAFTSHLPHLIAFSAMLGSSALSEELALDIALFNGGSYEDMTRVASADRIMWRDIFLTNAENISYVAHQSLRHIQDFLALMEKGDIEGLEERIGTARRLKQEQIAGRRSEECQEAVKRKAIHDGTGVQT